MKNANKKIAEREASRRRHTGAAVVLVTIGTLAFIGLVFAFFASLANDVRAQQAGMRADTPSEGIGRVYTAEAARYAAPAAQEEEGTALRVWCETDDPLPDWWDPSEAEIVYQAPIAQPTHSDALDYNLNTTVWGWDGHGAEIWELDLMSRIFYLEFWGASDSCCEAGCDAILRLWESGEFGNTLGGVLMAINAAGEYVYSTFPDVWTTNYNAEGLAWCRAYCEARFISGPTWIATYFQKYGYPVWPFGSPIPCYEFDGVYFSVARG